MRTRCCIVDCRRSTKINCRMWLCARHWRLVTPLLRERHKAASKEMRRHGRKHKRPIYDTDTANSRASGAANCAALCAWIACVRDATIQVAMERTECGRAA